MWVRAVADIHCLPLVEHDLPARSSFDEPYVRAKVFLRRSITGVEEWYYRLKVSYTPGEWRESIVIHGPYLTIRDAHKAAKDEIEFL